MEQNALRITGILEKQYPARVSPAGVPHQDFLLQHRSRQREAGSAREARLGLTVHCAGELVQQLQALQLGDRVLVTGFLALASYRDTEKVVLHAQTLDRQD